MKQEQAEAATPEDPQTELQEQPSVEEFYRPYLQLSRVACLPGDPEEQEFIVFRDHMFCDAAPEGAIEKMLVDRLVMLLWRLRRAGRIESELFSLLLPPPADSSRSPSPESGHDDGNPAPLLQQLAAESRPKELNALEWLQRYEAHLDRSVHRALAALQRQRYLTWQMNRAQNPPGSATESPSPDSALTSGGEEVDA